MPTPLVVGTGPVIRALCEKIGFVEAVNQTMAWDAQHCHLSPDERIFALIVNLLTARQPLYRVHEQFPLTDALGRTWDKVAAAGGATVFHAVATRTFWHDHVGTPDNPVFVHYHGDSRLAPYPPRECVPGSQQRQKNRYRVRLTIGAVNAQRVQAATFVLITNLPATPFDACRLLEEYKGQTVMEQRFRFLKDLTFVDALSGQKTERVEALGYVLLLAQLVLSFIERRARQTPPLPTPTPGL